MTRKRLFRSPPRFDCRSGSEEGEISRSWCGWWWLFAGNPGNHGNGLGAWGIWLGEHPPAKEEEEEEESHVVGRFHNLGSFSVLLW